jgi:hypothetical protein
MPPGERDSAIASRTRDRKQLERELEMTFI